MERDRETERETEREGGSASYHVPLPSAALTTQHQEDGAAPSKIQYVAFLMLLSAAFDCKHNSL